ncbi:MAG: PAS domain-containing protein [Alphaproteobacteria bacterium]|nr:PAS domain-containing protein [Alphaproteobacteria bacterium]
MAPPSERPKVAYQVDEADLAHDERLLGLYRLWQSKRKDRQLPSRAAFQHAELPPWFGTLILLDVLDGGADYRYRLFGLVLATEAGFDMTGKLLSKYPIRSNLPHFREVFAEVLRTRAPALSEHDPGVAHIRRRRRLILPLGKDGETVDMIMTANYAVEVVRKPDPYL